MMKINKNLKIALDFLGKEYSVKAIDGEDCIYRDLNNGYDIEVSGICSSRGKNVITSVYVWDVKKGYGNGASCVNKFFKIIGLENLKILLGVIVDKHGNCIENISTVMESIEWISLINDRGKKHIVCPVCRLGKTWGGNHVGHSDDCWLANEIYK